jgi:hypothetical protein
MFSIDKVCRRGQPLRHRAAGEKRSPEPGLGDTPEHPGGREPQGRLEPLAGLVLPLPVTCAAKRLAHEAQRQAPIRMVTRHLAEELKVQVAGGNHADLDTADFPTPQAAMRHIRSHGSREKQLPLRVPNNRLMGAQQGQITHRPRRRRIPGLLRGETLTVQAAFRRPVDVAHRCDAPRGAISRSPGRLGRPRQCRRLVVDRSGRTQPL